MSDKYEPGTWVSIRARVHDKPSPIPGETRVWLQSHNEDYSVLVTDDWIDGPTGAPLGWSQCPSTIEVEGQVDGMSVPVLVRCEKPSLHSSPHAWGSVYKCAPRTWTTDQQSGSIDPD